MASIQQQIENRRRFAHPERTRAGERQLQEEHPNGISGRYVATAYGPPWDRIEGSGVTATGTTLSPTVVTKMEGPYVVAVDPTVIPLGTTLYIWPNPFDYVGAFTADDTGGAIRGRRIDFYDPRGRVMQDAWGRRTVKVETKVIKKGNFENEDLGEGGPVPFGGLDTGKSPMSALETLMSRLGIAFSGQLWLTVAKVVFGGALLLLVLSRITGGI